MASPAASSNSDSGIFKEQQQQRPAAEPGLSVRAMPAPSAGAANDGSFNSERLEDQNSAENLRVSMQKYLKSKDAHLKSVSERLRRRAASGESSDYEAIGPASMYDGSAAARSLEDLPNASASAGLLTYLHAAKEAKEPQQPQLAQPPTVVPKLGQPSTILRPGDQYPSEPGVLHPATSAR